MATTRTSTSRNANDKSSSSDLAAQFRQRVGKVGAGGVVVLFDGVCCSWVNYLRNPEHWRIGTVAVAEDGRKWKAVGRVRANGDDTASAWSELIQEF